MVQMVSGREHDFPHLRRSVAEADLVSTSGILAALFMAGALFGGTCYKQYGHADSAPTRPTAGTVQQAGQPTYDFN